MTLATLVRVDVMESNKSAALSRFKKARGLLASLDAAARVAWIDEHISYVNEKQ